MGSRKLILLFSLICALCVPAIAAYTARLERDNKTSIQQMALNASNLYKDRFKFRNRHSRSIWQREPNTMLCEQGDVFTEPMTMLEPQAG